MKINDLEFASSFRYFEDIPTKILKNTNNKQYKLLDSHNSLMITNIISPIIYSSLKRVVKNLHLDIDKINLYVYASSEINAQCYNGINDSYVIVLTSGIVKLLENKELDFVLGHELGHLLLGHTKEEKFHSEAGMKLSRSKEFSVDRIGLVATRDIDIALRSIMKTISGLPSKFLNFNVSEFLDQLRKFDQFNIQLLDQSTHPSTLIRARALLLFSTSDKYQELFKRKGKKLLEIDKSIKRETDKHIDNFHNTRLFELKNNLSFWISCYAFILDNKLSNDEQIYIKEQFSKEKLQKFKSLIFGRKSSEIEKIIAEKLILSSKNLYNLKGKSINDDIENIIKNLNTTFKYEDLKPIIFNLLKITI